MKETYYRRRNVALVLCLIPLIFHMHQIGMFGFATITIGPEWLRFFWYIPGLLGLVLFWYLVRAARASREYWIPIATETIASGLDHGADLLFGAADTTPCSHCYPDGAAYCIYCGEKRVPAPAIGATTRL